jgi:pyruvate/2-oxoglutarate dehydrogenase complex dihydrolipoamide dehydrogenase (E3) component
MQVGRAWEKGETEGFLKILVDGETKNGVVPGDRVR